MKLKIEAFIQENKLHRWNCFLNLIFNDTELGDVETNEDGHVSKRVC